MSRLQENLFCAFALAILRSLPVNHLPLRYGDTVKGRRSHDKEQSRFRAAEAPAVDAALHIDAAHNMCSDKARNPRASMGTPFRSFQHNNYEASTPYITSIQWHQYVSVI